MCLVQAIDMPTGADALSYSPRAAANLALPAIPSAIDWDWSVGSPWCTLLLLIVSPASVTGPLTCPIGQGAEEVLITGDFDVSVLVEHRQQRAREDEETATRITPPRRRTIARSDNPARELRDLSGLPVPQLASVFGVSRVTYHKWLDGTTPRRERHAHLAEVVAQIKRAFHRLGTTERVKQWLLTPATADLKRPIDFLEMRRYDLFQGFLLKTPTGQERIRPVPSTSRLATTRSGPRSTGKDLEEGLERLRPKTHPADYED